MNFSRTASIVLVVLVNGPILDEVKAHLTGKLRCPCIHFQAADILHNVLLIPSPVGSYNCNTYSQYDKEVCHTHYIVQRIIEEIELNDIRSMMQLVEEDEAKARKQFLARKQRQESQQISTDKSKPPVKRVV